MEPGKNHINYTKADIQRYHSGKMPASEMHSMEKAALDDPFLADAMEGYAFTGDATTDLSEINSRLFREQPKKKPIPLLSQSWFRVAALFIIIAGAGLITYRLSKHVENNLALTKTSPTVRENAKVAVTDSLVLDSTPTVKDNRVETAFVKAGKIKNLIAQKSPLQNNADKTTTWAGATPPADAYVSSPAKPLPGSDSMFNAGKDISAKLEEITPGVNVISGKVTDEQGNALAGAVLTDEKRRQTSFTDNNGRFYLKSNDTTVMANVSVIGYQTLKRRLGNSMEQNIVLSPSKEHIEDIVVTGYQTKKKLPAATSAIKFDTAAFNGTKEEYTSEPEPGWQYFAEYIREKLSGRDDKAGPPEVHGQVTISFNVDQNGQPTKIKVENSINEQTDKTAVDLLKQGPKWKKTRKRTRVVIPF